MTIFEIINKSQKKIKLSKDEIFWMIENYSKDMLPDYQLSAWLATVFLNPLSDDEIIWLTDAIVASGHKMQWTPPTVDKHSTGGVGDKTSLIIGPLVSSMGYKIPMMSGRGLGHTGGTLDKLQSIPGFKIDYSLEDFKDFVLKNNICFIGQNEIFCPADKRLYALRDATHTVANIPLICASIMSKKIAEGLNGLVLDVKFGTGAFMEKHEDSLALAKKLIQIGEKNKIKTFAALSSMNQPLGRYVGNKLEVIECLEIMKSPAQGLEDYPDTFILSVLLSALMIYSLEPEKDLKQLYDLCFEQLMSGKVYDEFKSISKKQNGDIDQLKIEAQKLTLYSKEEGYFKYTDNKKMGFAAVYLGAGRLTKTDPVDSNVGYFCYKKTGDRVEKDEALFDIYYNDVTKKNLCLDLIEEAYCIEKKATSDRLIQEIIEFKDGSYKNINLKTKHFEV